MSGEDTFDQQVRAAREQVRRAQEQARAAREDWRRWQRQQQATFDAAVADNWRRAGAELRQSFASLEAAWKNFEQGWERPQSPAATDAARQESEMGRRRQDRNQEEDLVQLAGEKLRTLLDPSPSLDKERIRLERERLREERRRRRQAEGQADLIAAGIGLATGGLVSLAAVPIVAAVGAGLVAGGAAGAGLRWLAARQLRPPGLPRPVKVIAPALNAEGLNEARAETVRAILDHAAEQLRLAQAATANLGDSEIQGLLARLSSTGQLIIDRVAERPELLPRAQRVLTYHVERAVYLAETLAAMLASKAAEPQQIASAKHVLARMDNLFERTALELTAGDAKEMDLELRLIDQALDEDLKP